MVLPEPVCATVVGLASADSGAVVLQRMQSGQRPDHPGKLSFDFMPRYIYAGFQTGYPVQRDCQCMAPQPLGGIFELFVA